MNILNNIDVVILCGGLGTRLQPAIGARQKTMALVKGEPFLNFLLKDLKRQGFRRVVLCTGYQGATVERYYRKANLGLKILFSKEKEPLGTGGAVKNAGRLLKSGRFFVLNGDSFCRMDFARFLKFHDRTKAMVTVAAAKVKDARDYGTLRLGADGRVSAFLEKNPSAAGRGAYVNAGAYCFARSVLARMPRAIKFSLEKDFFPLIVRQRIYGFKVRGKFIDIGTPERYQKAGKFLRSKF